MQTNRSLVDGWTAVHFGAGLLAARAGVPLGRWVGLMVLYELVEQAVEASPQNPFGTHGPESSGNVLGDLLAGVAGYFAGQR